MVLAAAGRGDWILCQITSNPFSDAFALRIDDSSFASGSLRTISYARPGKLFTANEDLIAAPVGELKPVAFRRTIDAKVGPEAK